MKFLKGALIGTMISAGAIWMYRESMDMGKNKMIKKGKKILKSL